MGDLSLTVTLQGLLVGLLGKTKRIEEAHGGKGTGKVSGGEGVHGRGGLGHGSRGECGGRAGKEGGDSKLHHVGKC